MHIPVLLGEAIEGLNIKEGGVIVDVTLGAGGHTTEIARLVGDNGIVISFDIDGSTIEKAKEELAKEDPALLKRIVFVNRNFVDIKEVLEELEIEKVDGILADLGWRIEQIEDEKYGMSFQKKARLDMRLNPEEQRVTAREIVNNWNERELVRIFWEFGEEKSSRRIAQAIVKRRRDKEIETTTELAEILKKNKKAKNIKINPATKVFQALRIAVNDELKSLEVLLSESLDVLKSGGRLVVISFHSLEDRIVKNFFRVNAGGCVCPREFPKCVCDNASKIKIINKKAISATKDEVRKNKRSRSARLRIAEKV